MDLRAKKVTIEPADISKFISLASRYLTDPGDPTATSPLKIVRNRLRKILRVRAAAARSVFEAQVTGEKFVLYPMHLQPEASTLVQGPMFLDQLALIRDLAMSLPVGHRLYVKEHLSNRGRRPVSFYRQLREIPAVRLLGPDEDTWALIQRASAIAVIAGTMGWEGVLYDKPVIIFGEVFYDLLPHVYHAKLVPKDEWFGLLTRAISTHVPDRNAVLALINALHRASHPGFIANPNGFPTVLEPANIIRVADALCAELGIGGSDAKRDPTGTGNEARNSRGMEMRLPGGPK